MLESIKTIHYYNETVSSIVGILSNTFAIYLVKKRTDKNMRQYSQTLIQNCFVDLLCNIVILITKEQYEIYDGKFIYISTGFTSNISHPWDILFHMGYNYFNLFCITSMTIPFYCRYKVFCKGEFLSDYRVSKLYLIVSLITLSFGITYALSSLPHEKCMEETIRILKSGIFVNENGKLPIFAVSDLSNPFFIAATVLINSLAVLSYVIIIFLASKIYKKLLSKQAYLSPRNIRYHREINRVLIVQAITPVFTGSLAIGGALFIMISKLKISGLALLTSLPLSYNCMVNPLFAIFLVKTYRSAVFHPRKYLFTVSPKNHNQLFVSTLNHDSS